MPATSNTNLSYVCVITGGYHIKVKVPPTNPPPSSLLSRSTFLMRSSQSST